MLEAIIQYVQLILKNAYPTVEQRGLAVQFTGRDGDKESVQPATYCEGGEHQPIEWDFYSELFYFRRIADDTTRPLSYEESPGSENFEERSYALRLVACLPLNTIGSDNAYTPFKVGENLNYLLRNASLLALENTLKARFVELNINKVHTDKRKLWNEEYRNVAMPGAMDNKHFVAVDFTVTISANVSCFQMWDCDNSNAPVDFCPPKKLLYEDGTLFTELTAEETTIYNNKIYNADGSLNTQIKPQQSFTLPPLVECPPTDYDYTNSDGSYSGTGVGGTPLNIPDINITNSDASYTEIYPAVKDYEIPDTQLVDTEGGDLGTFPSITPITAPDVTLVNSNATFSDTALAGSTYIIQDTTIKNTAGTNVGTARYGEDGVAPDADLRNTAGTQIASAKSGIITTLPDVTARNSANAVVDTKPYGVDLSIGDTTIFKANGTTSLAYVVAEGSTTTSALIALMSAAEIYADLTTAGKIAALLALFTNSNLSTLSSAQLDYIVTLMSNSNLNNLSTAQKNYIVTILIAAQVQLLSNTQLNMLSTAQVAYIIANAAPTTYAFPETAGATTSYANGDAKWVRDAYFSSLTNGITPRLADFYNLKTYPNIYGNFKRFTGTTGGYQDDTGLSNFFDVNGNSVMLSAAFPDDYIIDHYTGLGWIRGSLAAGDWATAMARYATYSQSVGGVTKTDFFVPSINQVQSIRDIGMVSTGRFRQPFSPTNTNFWTSTTPAQSSANAIAVGANGIFSALIKTNTGAIHNMCRKHF